jgi:hypothetical protein
MTAGFIAAATGAATAANAISLTWPVVAAGDVAVLVGAIGGLSTLTDPTGFSAIDTLDESTVLRAKAWRKVCAGSETGTLSLAWTGTAQNGAAALVVYRGIDPTTPVHVHGVNGAVAAGTARAASAVANQIQPALEIAAYCDVNTTSAQSWTPPTGMNERADVSSAATPFVSVTVDDILVTGVTSTMALPARTGTSANSGAEFVAFHIGLLQLVSSVTDQSPDGTYLTEHVPGPAMTSIAANSFRVPVTSGQIWPRGSK